MICKWSVLTPRSKDHNSCRELEGVPGKHSLFTDTPTRQLNTQPNYTRDDSIYLNLTYQPKHFTPDFINRKHLLIFIIFIKK